MGGFHQSYAWKKKRKEIKELYDGKCAICGSSKNLQVHHIVPIQIIPTLKLDNDNLIAVCEKCHREIHNGIISSTNLIQKVKRT